MFVLSYSIQDKMTINTTTSEPLHADMNEYSIESVYKCPQYVEWMLYYIIIVTTFLIISCLYIAYEFIAALFRSILPWFVFRSR